MSTLCDLQAQASCMVSCGGGEGGHGGEAGTGGYGGYGGEGAYGGEGGSGGGTGTDIYPGCFTYAAKYCGCLGEYAAPDCTTTIAGECDIMYGLCPSDAVAYMACIEAQDCQGSWVDACPFDCNP